MNSRRWSVGDPGCEGAGENVPTPESFRFPSTSSSDGSGGWGVPAASDTSVSLLLACTTIVGCPVPRPACFWSARSSAGVSGPPLVEAFVSSMTPSVRAITYDATSCDEGWETVTRTRASQGRDTRWRDA